MTTPTTVPLTTTRLDLSPLQASDAQEMHPVLASPDLYRFTGGSPPTVQQLRDRYESQVAGPASLDDAWHNWIIRLRDERTAVGFVQATVSRDTADIAWLVGVAWQGRGIATEATSAMCGWLAAQGITRFVAHIHPDHVASARVAASAGLAPTDHLDPDGERIWSNRP